MITVVHPGLLTTVQDTGRYGYRKYGVIVSGAMDTFALRVANILVGNPENAAALEMTLIGPTLTFTQEALIAICGSGMQPFSDDQRVPMWRPVYVPAQTTLTFHPAADGCRAYLAISGGIDVPLVMGSRSTYLRAGIGGFHGRALHRQDELPIGTLSTSGVQRLRKLQSRSLSYPRWSATTHLPSTYSRHTPLRIRPGTQMNSFTNSSRQAFVNQSFVVGTQSDRMGYRLNGPRLRTKNHLSMLSTAVSFGTVQVPSDGNPIILMADHQTTGGYPQIANVITADLPRLAQVRPGASIQFQSQTMQQAHEQLLNQMHYIRSLPFNLALHDW